MCISKALNKKVFLDRSIKDVTIAFGPAVLCAVLAISAIYKYVDPAPPHRIVLSAGDEGNFRWFAKQYQGVIQPEGVTLEIKSSTGSAENLKSLSDPSSGVDAGFVQDGIGSASASPDVSSLGSLYYEPLWIFYNGRKTLARFSELLGKKIALGPEGSGTRLLATQILKASGITDQNTSFLPVAWADAADLLDQGKVDAAFLMASPGDPLISRMFEHKNYRLMSIDQAEALSLKLPFLHHLILPHGAIDLQKNIPDKDVDLIAPTATLVVKDKLHPALVYLLMKAMTQVHSGAKWFQKKSDFPANNDYVFPLNDEAKNYYKSGGPFWQRYLPFWVATLVNRFFAVALPLLAIFIPLAKSVPRLLDWRIQNRLYQRYGELKFLEVLARKGSGTFESLLHKLDAIEDRVNHMKVPLKHSEHIFSLRQNIQFVRQKIFESCDPNSKQVEKSKKTNEVV